MTPLFVLDVTLLQTPDEPAGQDLCGASSLSPRPSVTVLHDTGVETRHPPVLPLEVRNHTEPIVPSPVLQSLCHRVQYILVDTRSWSDPVTGENDHRPVRNGKGPSWV